MTVATEQGCLRCATAPDRILGIAGERDATCGRCGRRWLRLPLLAISGASGVGKTTATEPLPTLVPECIQLDGDLLWRHEYLDSPAETAYYYSTVLGLAVELHQHGHSVVFSGAVHPVRWEDLPLRAYVSAIHYLALVCDRDVHEERLRGRGADPLDDRYFEPSLDFNDWLRANAASTHRPMELLDTTELDEGETVAAVAEWVRARLEAT